MAEEAVVICHESAEKRRENGCSDTSVDAACQQVQSAITDRRENGGTKQQIRSAALRLIQTMFDDLDAEAR